MTADTLLKDVISLRNGAVWASGHGVVSGGEAWRGPFCLPSTLLLPYREHY